MSNPRIFIAPRSGEQSSRNFEKTIEGGYRKGDIEKYLSTEDKEALKNETTLMIWGNKPSLRSRWEKMQIDDWVFFYQHGKISYAGHLLYKTHNKKLADELWGQERNQKGELASWEYVFFLKDLREVDLNYKIMADLAGYEGAVVQGFLPYSEIGVANIIKKYGDIEGLLFNKSNYIGSDRMEEKKEITNTNSLLMAAKTKPFILLAGISGIGKSRLARTLAYKTCAKAELRIDPKKPGNFELIPVRPNWHDSSELMGYISRINGEKYITTSFLQFIAKAWKNLDIPFFLCLDEMNLAPVEQYFAEYLSIIETRQRITDEIVTDYLIAKSNFENQNLYSQMIKDIGLQGDPRFDEGVGIPCNLVVIGTVNMDETTHSFSRKVLDRAMTFEMNNVDLNAGLASNENDWSYPSNFISLNEVIGEYTAGNEVINLYPESETIIKYLQDINNQLEGSPFKIAYRVRDEFLIYGFHASQNQSDANWLQNALDEMTSMKILSRIEGDEAKTANILKNLQNILDVDYKKSNAKLKEMEIRLQNSGYTSFWS